MDAFSIGVSALAVTQQLINITGQNIANADTPGYQREDVNFQSTLENALQSGQSASSVNFTPQVQSGTVSADGNGVSGEQDSADLAENGLLYENLTAIAAQREEILKTAMGAPS